MTKEEAAFAERIAKRVVELLERKEAEQPMRRAGDLLSTPFVEDPPKPRKRRRKLPEPTAEDLAAAARRLRKSGMYPGEPDR